MSNEKLNIIMTWLFLIMFSIVGFMFFKNINEHSKIVDKLVEISNKAIIDCQVKTNHIFFITSKKLVK